MGMDQASSTGGGVMPMLTFTDQFDELLSGRKTMTTRHNFERWQKIWRKSRCNTFLHVWWKNPRNRHPHCYKMGVARLVKFEGRLGRYLTQEDAVKDGFNSLAEYTVALSVLNHLSFDEVDNHFWALLPFEWEASYPLIPPWWHHARKVS